MIIETGDLVKLKRSAHMYNFHDAGYRVFKENAVVLIVDVIEYVVSSYHRYDFIIFYENKFYRLTEYSALVHYTFEIA